MTPKEIRQSAAHLRAVNKDERTVDIVASTFDLDSYGTRIDQTGWDFTAFKKNPVICLQHDDRGYTESNGLPVANAIPETVRVENQQCLMRLRFPAVGTFPLADLVFNLVSDGFLRGVSVGFEPTEWEDIEEDDEKGYKRRVRVFKRQRLLEVSLVTIPSNDNALVQRAREMNREADVEKIRSVTEQVEQLAKEQETRFDPAEVEKWKNYFERKQPVNKVSVKVMERFFRKRGEQQPSDEIEAWTRMGELLDEEPKPEEKPEEEPAPEIPVEEKEETTEQPTNPPAEAPQDERKASVHIPVLAVRELPKNLVKALTEAAVEALQRGVPVSEVGGVLDAVGEKLKASFIRQ